MGKTVGAGSRRQRSVVVPEERQHRLRQRLLGLYRGHKDYWVLVTTLLCPRFAVLAGSKVVVPYAEDDDAEDDDADATRARAVCSHAYLVRVQRRLRALAQASEDVEFALRELDQYLGYLRFVVKVLLRLNAGGQPVEWAVVALHDDVRGVRPDDSGPDYRHKSHQVALHINLLPREAHLLSVAGGAGDFRYATTEDGFDSALEAVTLTLRHDVPPPSPPQRAPRIIGPRAGEARRHTAPLPGCSVEQRTVAGGSYSFDAWDALEREAVEMLKETLRSLRLAYYGDYDQVANSERLDTESEKLEPLFAFLFREPWTLPLLRDERRTARAMAQDIGIDLPRARSRTTRK